MKKFTLILAGLISGLLLCAQAQTMVGGNAAKGIDMNTMPYGFISAFGSKEKTTVGSKYLYDNWKVATIQLNETEIKNCPVNIDLKNALIEINTDKGIRTLPAGRVKKLIVGYENIGQQVFESTKNYNGHQAQISGLVEVLVNNDPALLKYYYSYVKEGSYNAQLDMGSNETKYMVKSDYYLFSNGTLVGVPTSKKKFMAHVPAESQPEVEKFLKEERISLKDQQDLIKLTNFLKEHSIHIQHDVKP